MTLLNQLDRSKFVPRTDAIKAKILSEWAEASKLLDEDGNYTEAFYKNEFKNHGS